MKKRFDQNGFLRYQSDSGIVDETTLRNADWLLIDAGGRVFDSTPQFFNMCFPELAEMGGGKMLALAHWAVIKSFNNQQ